MTEDPWKLCSLDEIKERLTGEPVEYLEFLRLPSLSCGLNRLGKGSDDMQSPHDDDEVYYVLEGHAMMEIGGERKSVGPGSIVFVGATESHSFFEIDEDMLLLVFFAAASPLVQDSKSRATRYDRFRREAPN